MKGYATSGGPAAWSPDGKRLAADGRIWERGTGKTTALDLAKGTRFNRAHWLDDRRVVMAVALPNDQKKLIVFDAITGEQRSEVPMRTELSYFTFCGGKLLAPTFGRTPIRIVSTETGSEVNLIGHAATPSAVAPDGKRLAVWREKGGRKHTWLLYALFDWGVLAQRSIESGFAGWSPDGKHVVTDSGDVFDSRMLSPSFLGANTGGQSRWSRDGTKVAARNGIDGLTAANRRSPPPRSPRSTAGRTTPPRSASCPRDRRREAASPRPHSGGRRQIKCLSSRK